MATEGSPSFVSGLPNDCEGYNQNDPDLVALQAKVLAIRATLRVECLRCGVDISEIYLCDYVAPIAPNQSTSPQLSKPNLAQANVAGRETLPTGADASERPIHDAKSLAAQPPKRVRPIFWWGTDYAGKEDKDLFSWATMEPVCVAVAKAQASFLELNFFLYHWVRAHPEDVRRMEEDDVEGETEVIYHMDPIPSLLVRNPARAPVHAHPCSELVDLSIPQPRLHFAEERQNDSGAEEGEIVCQPRPYERHLGCVDLTDTPSDADADAPAAVRRTEQRQVDAVRSANDGDASRPRENPAPPTRPGDKALPPSDADGAEVPRENTAHQRDTTPRKCHRPGEQLHVQMQAEVPAVCSEPPLKRSRVEASVTTCPRPSPPVQHNASVASVDSLPTLPGHGPRAEAAKPASHTSHAAASKSKDGPSSRNEPANLPTIPVPVLAPGAGSAPSPESAGPVQTKALCPPAARGSQRIGESNSSTPNSNHPAPVENTLKQNVNPRASSLDSPEATMVASPRVNQRNHQLPRQQLSLQPASVAPTAINATLPSGDHSSASSSEESSTPSLTVPPAAAWFGSSNRAKGIGDDSDGATIGQTDGALVSSRLPHGSVGVKSGALRIQDLRCKPNGGSWSASPLVWTKTELIEYLEKPFFERAVKGAFVRLVCDRLPDGATRLLCNVRKAVIAEPVYQLECVDSCSSETTEACVYLQLYRGSQPCSIGHHKELRIGKERSFFPISAIADAGVQRTDFSRYKDALERNGEALPARATVDDLFARAQSFRVPGNRVVATSEELARSNRIQKILDRATAKTPQVAQSPSEAHETDVSPGNTRQVSPSAGDDSQFSMPPHSRTPPNGASDTSATPNDRLPQSQASFNPQERAIVPPPVSTDAAQISRSVTGSVSRTNVNLNAPTPPSNKAGLGVQPDAVHASGQNPTDHASGQNVTDHASVQPPTDHASVQKLADHASAQKPTDHASAQKPTDHASAQKPTGHASPQKPTDHASPQKSTSPNPDQRKAADAPANADGSRHPRLGSPSELPDQANVPSLNLHTRVLSRAPSAEQQGVDASQPLVNSSSVDAASSARGCASDVIHRPPESAVSSPNGTVACNESSKTTPGNASGRGSMVEPSVCRGMQVPASSVPAAEPAANSTMEQRNKSASVKVINDKTEDEIAPQREGEKQPQDPGRSFVCNVESDQAIKLIIQNTPLVCAGSKTPADPKVGPDDSFGASAGDLVDLTLDDGGMNGKDGGATEVIDLIDSDDEQDPQRLRGLLGPAY